MSYDQRLLFDQISVCLHENPCSSLEGLSRRLRVGRRTIERAVSFATLRKFRDFREEALIARLATLIRLQPTLAIKELSFAVGYKSPRSFARAIKRVSGFSPEQFRSSVGQQLLGAQHRQTSYEITHDVRQSRRRDKTPIQTAVGA
jgi:AraC-like DNA-binding protein